MGSSVVKPIRVLLVGLSGVGKTHFLDTLVYNADTTKQPTTGFYEVVHQGVCFIEYGGSVVNTVLHTEPFDAVVYIVCGETFSKQQLLQAKSHLLGTLSKFPDIPLCIIIKNVSARGASKLSVWKTMDLECLDPAIICMDFDKKDSFEEGCRKLFGWLKNLHTVTGNSATN